MFSADTFQQRRNQPSGAVISDCQQYRYLLWRVWDKAVTALLRQKNIAPQCFAVTGKGQPKHPLYLPNGIAPIDFLP